MTKKLSDAERYQHEQDVFFADLEAAATEKAAKTELDKLAKTGLTPKKIERIRKILERMCLGFGYSEAQANASVDEMVKEVIKYKLKSGTEN